MKKSEGVMQASESVHTDIKTLYQDFKKRRLIPPFRNAGFRIETPGRYVRDVGDVHQAVYLNAQGNHRNDPNRKFTFDIAIGDTLIHDDGPYTGFTCRFGYLKCASDAWFYLYPHNEQSLGDLVALELERYAIPLLDWATNQQRVEHLKALTAQGHSQLTPQLRALVPGFGRDFAAEFQTLWTGHVVPLLCAVDFTEQDGVLVRSLGSGITQAFSWRYMTNDTQSFLDLEGILAVHVPTPEHPEPIAPMRPPVWWLVSSTYVVSGHSSHFRRYQLAEHTPGQMGALLRSDLEQHLQPWFDRHITASDISLTRRDVDAYLQQRTSPVQIPPTNLGKLRLQAVAPPV